MRVPPRPCAWPASRRTLPPLAAQAARAALAEAGWNAADITHLEGWLREWLAAQSLSMQDVASWAVHPGGPRILTAVEEALGLERAASVVPRQVLSEFGNMSSATILFTLQRMRMQGAPLPLVGLAFGPGLVVEAVLVR